MQYFSYLLYEMTSINFRTLIIYCGTLFFGIAALICFGASIRIFFNKNKKHFYEWFWISSYVSVFVFAGILFKAGLIGLKIWSM